MAKRKKRSTQAERDSAFYRRIIPGLLPIDSREEAKLRIQSFLDALKKRGVSQARLAVVIGVPVQYICDVKNGRRTVSELFARRIQDACGINHLWLLGRSDDQKPATPRVLL